MIAIRLLWVELSTFFKTVFKGGLMMEMGYKQSVINKMVTMILVLVVVILDQSCSKTQPNIEAPGAFDHLVSKDLYSNKTCSLTTKDALLATGSKAPIDVINIENEERRLFDFVDYTTDCPYMHDVPFRARKNTTYQIEMKYEGEPAQLLFYKVANKKDFSYSEESMLEERENGKFAVPFMSYKLTLVRKTKVPNTNQISSVPTIHLDEATHIGISPYEREMINPYDKSLVFDKSYFNGQWYLGLTVLEDGYDPNHPDHSAVRGTLLNNNYGQRLSGQLIHFYILKDRILAKNSNTDPSLDGKRLSNPSVFSFGLNDILDFRKNPRTKKEEALGNKHVESRKFQNRQYIDINIEDFQSEDLESLYAWNKIQNKGAIELKRLDLGKDYLSINYLDPNLNVLFKFSLKRAPLKAKKGRLYPLDDMEIFGFFKEVKPKIRDVGYTRKVIEEEGQFLIRHYPNDGVIRYHLSNQTDDQYRPIVQSALDKWNQAFEQAFRGSGKKPIQVKLENDKVQVGDIRYNVVHFIDEAFSQPYGGFGPTFNDPRSGEIIAATANISVRAYKNSLHQILRSYILNKLGYYDSNRLTTQSSAPRSHFMEFILSAPNNDKSFLSPINLQTLTDYKTSTYRSDHRSEIPLFDHHSTMKVPDFLTQMLKTQFEPVENKEDWDKLLESEDINLSLAHQHHIGETCFYKSIHDDLYQYFDKFCDLNDYVDKIKSLGINFSAIDFNEEKRVFASCINKIIPIAMEETLLHELGHNMGLRHNFMGSYDAFNFPKDKETGEVLSQWSSIMDYPVSRIIDKKGSSLGGYDIAAIRYAYANAVELKDQSIVLIEDNKSIKAQLDQRIRPFSFCTDEHVGMSGPFCNRHDKGTTPLEVTEFYITSAKDLFSSYSQGQFVSSGVNSSDILYSLYTGVFVPLKRIYDYWRDGLTQYLSTSNYRKNDPFLINMGIQSKDNSSKTRYEISVLDEMKREGSLGKKHYDQYFKASREIFNFFLQTAFIPQKTCVAKLNQNDSIVYFKLEDINKNVKTKFDSDSISTSCFHPDVKQYIGESWNAVVIDEFGSILLDHARSESFLGGVNGLKVEQAGILGVKYLAGSMLVDRKAQTWKTYRNAIKSYKNPYRFNYNFLDEPDLKEKYEDILIERLTLGVTNKTAFYDKYSGLSLPSFHLEKNFLSTLYYNLIYGQTHPDYKSYTSQNMNRYTVYLNWNPKQFKDYSNYSLPPGKFMHGGVLYSADREDNPVSFDLISALRENSKVMDVFYHSEKIQEVLPDPTQYSLEDFWNVLRPFSPHIPMDKEGVALMTVYEVQQYLEALKNFMSYEMWSDEKNLEMQQLKETFYGLYLNSFPELDRSKISSSLKYELQYTSSQLSQIQEKIFGKIKYKELQMDQKYSNDILYNLKSTIMSALGQVVATNEKIKEQVEENYQAMTEWIDEDLLLDNGQRCLKSIDSHHPELIKCVRFKDLWMKMMGMTFEDLDMMTYQGMESLFEKMKNNVRYYNSMKSYLESSTFYKGTMESDSVAQIDLLLEIMMNMGRPLYSGGEYGD